MPPLPEDTRAGALAGAGLLPKIPEDNRAIKLSGTGPMPAVAEDGRASSLAEAGEALAWPKQAEAFGMMPFSRSKTSALTFDISGLP